MSALGPGCVKTILRGQRRKIDSCCTPIAQGWHTPSAPLIPIFRHRARRRSFHTAWTQSGHAGASPGLNRELSGDQRRRLASVHAAGTHRRNDHNGLSWDARLMMSSAEVMAAEVMAADIGEAEPEPEPEPVITWAIIAWPVIAWPIATSIIVTVVAPSCRDYADWVRGIRFRSRRGTRRHRSGTIRRPRVIRLHAA